MLYEKSHSINNSGNTPILGMIVDILDDNDNLIDSLTVNQIIDVGEIKEINIPFTLASEIERSNYKIQISPANGTDYDVSDNETNVSFGFADLEISDVKEIRVDNDRQLEITITNVGNEAVDSAVLSLQKDNNNGRIVDEKEIVTIDVGESKTEIFDLSSSELDSASLQEAWLFYVKIGTEIEENDYSNNDYTIPIYPDYTLNISSTTGGSVNGSGIYPNGTIVEISATPLNGYLFDGWYENGELLAGVPQNATLSIFSNRSLEARFRPTDFEISNIKISGKHLVGSVETITVSVNGGELPYNWEITILQDNKVCYEKNSIIETNYQFIPQKSGRYSAEIEITDGTGNFITQTLNFKIEEILKITIGQTIHLSELVPENFKVSYWKSDNKLIASVDENGILIGKRLGETTIYAVSTTGTVMSWNIEVKLAWWQIILIAFGIGAVLLPFWVYPG